jgi:hypothetical protein
MKKTIVLITAFAILGLASTGLAAKPYRHETALRAAVENKQPSAWVLQRLGGAFFEQKDIRTVTDFPLAAREVFTKGKDNRVYMLSRWHDFDPQKTYTFSAEWIDPDGQSYSTAFASFQTPETLDPTIFFTYTAYLDLHNEMQEGRWTVHIFLNGELMEVKNLVIGSE